MKTTGGLRFKDYTFPDGYAYRQYTDGSILILRSPRGGTGTLVTKDVNYRAWLAITNSIQALRAGKRADTIAQFAQIAQSIVASLPKKRVPADEPPYTPPPEAEPPSIPWVPIGLAGAALALVLVLKGS